MADKQILARYVHDAFEMEVSRYTLNELHNSVDRSRRQQIAEQKIVYLVWKKIINAKLMRTTTNIV